jgi:hypothetical protein
MAIGVLPFVLEADADAIFAKASQRFLQFVVESPWPTCAARRLLFRRGWAGIRSGCGISNPRYRHEKPAWDHANSRHPPPFEPS